MHGPFRKILGDAPVNMHGPLQDNILPGSPKVHTCAKPRERDVVCHVSVLCQLINDPKW